MFVLNRKVNTTEIKYTRELKNAGYAGYWKLISQMYKQLDKMEHQMGYMTQYFDDGELVTKKSMKKVRRAVRRKTPYWALIKPLGWMFHRYIKYNGSFTKQSDNDGPFYIAEVSIKKTYTMFFLRIIPIWHYTTKKLNDEDKEYIFKEDVHLVS